MQDQGKEAHSGGRYRAFISYSHGDNREAGRKWADWLHHSLETYQIPTELIGQRNAQGQTIPAQIFPVFQDEKELSANADLSASLKHALDHSDFLVFLASPRSAQSVYVQEELRHFKQAGKSKQIIALILRGEPEYGAAQTEAQCFPDVLRHGVDAQGNLLASQTDEALAADVRLPHTQEEGFTSVEAYRQQLQAQGVASADIKQRTQAYGERLNLAKLKIISTILGVPLADLTQRDQAYQLERMRRRHRVVRGVAAGMGGLAVAAAIAGVVAWQQKGQAQKNFALTLYTSGLNKLAQNEYGDPAAYIAASVRQGNANATAFAESMLSTKEDLTLLPNMSKADMVFSPDGHYLAGRASLGPGATQLQVWDVRKRKKLANVVQPGAQRGMGKLFFDDGNRLYFTDDKFRVVRYDLSTTKTQMLVPNEAGQQLMLMAVSPDGQWLGMRHLGDNIHLRRADGGGEPSMKVPASLQEIVQLDFATDSSAAALCAERADKVNECHILNLSGPEPTELKSVNVGMSNPNVVLADGGKKAVFWRSAKIDVWDGGELRTMATGGQFYQWVALNPDAQSLLAVSDGVADVFRWSDGEREASHTLPMHALKDLLPDGGLLKSGTSSDATHAVVARNARAFLQREGPAPQLLKQLTFPGDTRRMGSDANGKYLFSLRKNGTSISRTLIADGQSQDNFIQEQAPITNLHVLRSGVVVTTTGNFETRLYDAETGKPIGDVIRTRSAMKFSADDKQMTARTADNSMGIWQASDGKETLAWQEPQGPLLPYTLSPGLTRMVQANDKGWRATDLASRKELLAGNDALTVAQYSPDASQLLTVNKNGGLVVWNLATGKRALELQSIAVPLARFSPDGKTLVVSEDARRLRLWNLQTGQSVGQVIPVSANVQLCEFSQDGQRLFVQDNVPDSLTPAVKVIDSHNGNLIAMPFAQISASELMLVNQEQQLITVATAPSAIKAQVWQVPGAMHLPPEQLANDLESFYGRRYDMDTGAIVSFDGSGRYASWFFQDPYTRSVTPTSQTSVPADITRQLPIKNPAQMQSLAALYLYHPLARAGIAEYLARQGKMDALSLLIASATQKQLDNATQMAASSDVVKETQAWLARAREQLAVKPAQ